MAANRGFSRPVGMRSFTPRVRFGDPHFVPRGPMVGRFNVMQPNQGQKRMMPPGPRTGTAFAKRMRMTQPSGSGVNLTAIMPPSSGNGQQQTKAQNPVMLLNLYKPGLSYNVVGQTGPAHSPVFTVQVVIDGKVFTGTGLNKACARYNTAQNAVSALWPVISSVIEQQQQQKSSEVSGNGTKSENDFTSDVDANALNTFQEGTSAGSDNAVTVKKHRAKNALKVLKEIRPGTACVENTAVSRPGNYVASVVVDGYQFQGQGASLSLAKSLAAGQALTSLFNLPLTYSAGGFPMYDGDTDDYIHLRPANIPSVALEDKNPIMVLNEIYYDNAVYEFSDDGVDLPDGSFSCPYGEMRHGAVVTVDGVVGTGRGLTRKDAKLNAAVAAISQLESSGKLQQRLSEKEISKEQRKAALSVEGPSANVANPGVAQNMAADNALAKLNNLYRGLNYDIVYSDTSVTGQTTFTVSVNVDGQAYTGTGRSKKTARLEAAESALRALNLWTKQDDIAKAKARKAASAARKSLGASGASSQPQFASTGYGNQALMQSNAQFGFGRGRARGMAVRGRGRGRGGGPTMSAVACEQFTPDTIDARNPIMLLNEVYLANVFYEFSDGGWAGDNSGFRHGATVTVEDLTASGQGATRKEAKFNAAAAAIQQLMASGVLQQRLMQKQSQVASNKSGQRFGLTPIRRGAVFPARGRSIRGVRQRGFSRGMGQVGTRGRGSNSVQPFVRGRGYPGVPGRGRGRARGLSRGRAAALMANNVDEYGFDMTDLSSAPAVPWGMNPARRGFGRVARRGRGGGRGMGALMSVSAYEETSYDPVGIVKQSRHYSNTIHGVMPSYDDQNYYTENVMPSYGDDENYCSGDYSYDFTENCF